MVWWLGGLVACYAVFIPGVVYGCKPNFISVFFHDKLNQSLAHLG